MGKLPGFTFYPGDWMKDPSLRSVSCGARGLWIDMLSLMFECDRRGHLTINGKPVSAEMLARMTGNSTDDVSRYLQELEHSGVFSRLDDGTIYSRRQVRDERIRAKTRERVTKHRRNDDVTVSVTPLYEDEDVIEKDVGFDLGSKKAESKTKPCFQVESDSDQSLDMQVHEIAALYPKVHDAFHLSRELAGEIAEAIVRDGRDLVWAGTKCMAEVVKKWPKSERKFIPAAPRYFRDSQYRMDPVEWERKGNGTNKAEQRQASNLAARDEVRAKIMAGGSGNDSR
jgi:hypothetical protein